MEITTVPRSNSTMWMLFDVLSSLRPRQWVKNSVLFAGLVFAGKMLEIDLMAKVGAAAVLFCGVSGSVYIINDIRDMALDRQHSKKRLRPIASGRLQVNHALIVTVAILSLVIPTAFVLNRSFGAILSGYLALMLAYSYGLKCYVILDVLIIAAGFVIRAVAGSVVVGVPISPWLYVCTSLLALFLGFCKRRHELVLLAHDASKHRKILAEYTQPLLDQLISIVASSAVIAYSLYTFFSETSHHTPYMMMTIPLVVYAIFRYLYLIYKKGDGGSPEDVLLKDQPLLGSILIWGVIVMILLYTAA